MTTERTVKVSVELPQNVWGRLATIAEDRGVTVAQVIGGAVIHELRPKDRRQWILALVKSGYCDRRVAEITGELKQYVSQVRRAAGMPANRDRERGGGK